MKCCGVINVEGIFYKIYVDATDRLFTDICSIVGVRLSNTLDVDFEDIKWKLSIGVYGDCLGVAVCEDYAVKFGKSGERFTAYINDWEEETPFRLEELEKEISVVDIYKKGLTYYEILDDGENRYYYDDFRGEFIFLTDIKNIHS